MQVSLHQIRSDQIASWIREIESNGCPQAVPEASYLGRWIWCLDGDRWARQFHVEVPLLFRGERREEEEEESDSPCSLLVGTA